MIERKTVSQCISSDYCKGWNDAVYEMMQKLEYQRTENGMRYGDIMKRLAVILPGYAKDCRPADGIANALIVWTHNDEVVILQYNKLLDCFFKIGERFE